MAPATKGGAAERRHTKWRRKAPYLPSGAVLYNYPGRSPQTACKAQPFTGRTLGAQGRRPGGCLNPRGEAASTFGNTAKRRFPSKAPRLKYRTQQKSTNDFSLVLFPVNQQLPILPGRFQPSTFGVCELNYRVRHGYGCILTAIATESLRVCTLKTV